MKVTQGDIIARTMTFTDQSTGDPYDLTIYNAIKMQIRKSPGSAIIAEGTLAAGNFTISVTDDNILEISGIEIPGNTPAGVYLYDIEFSNAGADIKETLVSGTITITAQITV
jgi:hypothetical protein